MAYLIRIGGNEVRNGISISEVTPFLGWVWFGF